MTIRKLTQDATPCAAPSRGVACLLCYSFDQKLNAYIHVPGIVVHEAYYIFESAYGLMARVFRLMYICVDEFKGFRRLLVWPLVGMFLGFIQDAHFTER